VCVCSYVATASVNSHGTHTRAQTCRMVRTWHSEIAVALSCVHNWALNRVGSTGRAPDLAHTTMYHGPAIATRSLAIRTNKAVCTTYHLGHTQVWAKSPSQRQTTTTWTLYGSWSWTLGVWNGRKEISCRLLSHSWRTNKWKVRVSQKIAFSACSALKPMDLTNG